MEQLLEKIIFNNSIHNYLTASGILVAVYIGLIFLKAILSKSLQKLADKTSTDFDDFIVSLIRRTGTPSFLMVAIFSASHKLVLPVIAQKGIRYAFIIVLTIQVIVLIEAILRYSVNKTLNKNKEDDPGIETVSRNIVGILRWLVWVLGILFIMDNLGINISALMAGIGIGGIAVAMASQELLKDALSAVSIFIDKPFKVGDFIVIADMMGTVEYIGIKTTRIRSISGEQLIFANSDLTASRIRNYKLMQERRVVFQIGVTYQTPTEKLKGIPDTVRGIISGIEGVRCDRAHFKNFGDFSLNFEFVYYVIDPDFNVYMNKQQAINLAIKESFESSGIEFAYPSQTIFLAKDS